MEKQVIATSPMKTRVCPKCGSSTLEMPIAISLLQKPYGGWEFAYDPEELDEATFDPNNHVRCTNPDCGDFIIRTGNNFETIKVEDMNQVLTYWRLNVAEQDASSETTINSPLTPEEDQPFHEWFGEYVIQDSWEGPLADTVILD